MGYSCTLELSKKIETNELEDVLDSMASRFRGFFGENYRHDWGWSCACDVTLLESNKLSISGSGSVSGNIAEDFIEDIEIRLNEIGIEIKEKAWSY